MFGKMELTSVVIILYPGPLWILIPTHYLPKEVNGMAEPDWKWQTLVDKPMQLSSHLLAPKALALLAGQDGLFSVMLTEDVVVGMN